LIFNQIGPKFEGYLSTGTKMSKVIAVLKAISVTGVNSEDISKALICWDETAMDSANFCLKSINDQFSSEFVENLRIALIEYNSAPQTSLNSCLKALEALVDLPASTQLNPDFFQNLRVAFLEFESAPETSLNCCLKAFESLSPLSQAPEEEADKFQNLRIAFLESIEDPKQALNLILKVIETLPEFSIVSDLRKGFLSFEEKSELESINHFLRYFGELEKSPFISDIRKSIQKFPQANWADAFSFGQIQSKVWLIEEWSKLKLPLPKMSFILGGWYGLLAALAEARNQALSEKYRSFDVDAECTLIADSINKTLLLNDWKFKATTEDMHKINYHGHDYHTLKSDGSEVRLIESPDLIINTSCEHIGHFSEWYATIPDGTTLILQSNDFFDEATHINCSKNLQEFQSQCKMSKVLFAGEKEFPLYKRFMLIGIKS